jgi:hypothetical protein
VDFTETEEYQAGIRWADQNRSRLVERYSSKELDTSELRSYLFDIAERLYPARREDMDNDIKQDYWVAGAYRRLVDTLPFSPEAMAAVFDAAMEMGVIISTEVAKKESLEALKAKSAAWWRTKFGDAKPNDILKALYSKWWREVGMPEKRSRTTKWEALKYVFGSREMSVLDTIQKIEARKDGPYEHWEVEGEHGTFDIMSKDVWQGGVLVQGAGEIVG